MSACGPTRRSKRGATHGSENGFRRDSQDARGRRELAMWHRCPVPPRHVLSFIHVALHSAAMHPSHPRLSSPFCSLFDAQTLIPGLFLVLHLRQSSRFSCSLPSSSPRPPISPPPAAPPYPPPHLVEGVCRGGTQISASERGCEERRVEVWLRHEVPCPRGEHNERTKPALGELEVERWQRGERGEGRGGRGRERGRE